MSEAHALTNLIGNGVATVVVSKALRGEAPDLDAKMVPP